MEGSRCPARSIGGSARRPSTGSPALIGDGPGTAAVPEQPSIGESSFCGLPGDCRRSHNTGGLEKFRESACMHAGCLELRQRRTVPYPPRALSVGNRPSALSIRFNGSLMSQSNLVSQAGRVPFECDIFGSALGDRVRRLIWRGLKRYLTALTE